MIISYTEISKVLKNRNGFLKLAVHFLRGADASFGDDHQGFSNR
jgi:hypothetical protein